MCLYVIIKLNIKINIYIFYILKIDWKELLWNKNVFSKSLWKLFCFWGVKCCFLKELYIDELWEFSFIFVGSICLEYLGLFCVICGCCV